ncbi:hypothetical protein [Actinoallomurus acanthiterrae]
MWTGENYSGVRRTVALPLRRCLAARDLGIDSFSSSVSNTTLDVLAFQSDDCSGGAVDVSGAWPSIDPPGQSLFLTFSP